MDLRLPLVVVQRAQRLVEAFVPTLAGVHMTGPSLSEMRDDLALKVMELFERAPADRLGDFQLPPHVSLKHVKLDAIAQDRPRRKKIHLEGRVAVLVEKWPADDFWIVTPTRLPDARFALRSADELEKALARRLGAYCLGHGIDTLDEYVSAHRERLDILEVDADAPTILPRGPQRYRRRPKSRAKGTKTSATEAPPETPEQREERRRRRRSTVRALREVGRNLAHGARDGELGRAYGREALVRELVDEFDGREGAAIVLIGPPGAGKTAIVHEVIQRLVARQAASGGAAARRDVWRVDGNRFIAGMMYVGQWEARARMLVDEAADLGDVLYVDDLASMVFAGRSSKGDTNVAQFLEPHLARGELTVLAESTAERFERVREEAPTFASHFRVVRVPPMTDRETLPVLLGVLRELEAASDERPVQITPAALEAVIDTTRRFMAHEALPGKAVRLLREAASAASVSDETSLRVDASNVLDAVERQTGLPRFVLGDAAPQRPAEVRRTLGAMVAGQPEAIDAIADAVITLQHALSDPDKPVATYLFVGPTGVGKTETAKALARYLFGSPHRLVRFDMSEFGSSASIARLVGWAGEPDGELTTALRTQPFCVVLFDEIEKAHPRVFDALLQLLGEGRLTDAAGRTADARQAVVIMTSNLGVREAAQSTGFLRGDAHEARKHYVGSVEKFFRPEFFNRIDRVVAFRSLGPEALRVVVEHALGELLSRRGIRRGNVVVDVEPELLDLLVEQAFDPRYGARPLRRALERRLAVPLAHHLVRRREQDLALVELFRRGEDMGLAVRALREAEPLDDPERGRLYGPDEVVDVFREVISRLDALEQSPEAARLEDVRALALRAASVGEADAHAAGIELLERLAAARERARSLEEGPLADTAYAEQEVAVRGNLRERYRNDSLAYGRHRKNSKQQTGFVDLPLSGSTEAQVRRATPDVLALRDELDVLEHQLRAAAQGSDDHFTVLIEGVTSDASSEAIEQARAAIPMQLGRARAFVEVQSPDAPPRWVAHAPTPRELIAHAPEPRAKRVCVALRGPGLRALLEPLAGFALLYAQDALGPRAQLVAIELLDGDEGPERVLARDRVVAEARRARREAADDPVSEPGLLVVRQQPDAPLCEHLATGVAVGAHDAVAAAVLRARRAIGPAE